MTKDPESFDELIGAIADGDSIDWSRVREAGRIPGPELRAARDLAGMRDSSERRALEASANPDPTAVPKGFTRIRRIGHGAFGQVWLARDEALGRDVALKVLEDDGTMTPEQRTRFVREARLLAACEHDNIVRIHSIEERDGRLELCLEFVDGVTFEQLVRDDGPRSAAEAARIGVDVCRALAAMHARGLIHRDVKPANVMRSAGGRIVLLDFGLAHTIDVHQRRGPTAGGTPRLMAPELIAGRGELDGRVDLYSLGVTLYWLVTGQWPYEAASRDELLHKIVKEPPIPLVDRRADLPAAFVSIVERALARDPAQRFATAGEMEAALRAFLSWEGGHDEIWPPPPRRAGVKRTLTMVAAVALLAVSSYAAWSLRPLRASVVVQRMVQAADGEWVKQAISPESPLKVDDRVVADLELNRDAWVYAFNVDDAGQFFAVFPLRETLLRNPLPAGSSTLPGEDETGARRKWVVDGRSSKEHFFFFVSRSENARLQALWNDCGKPGKPKEASAPPPDDLIEGILHDTGAARSVGGLDSDATNRSERALQTLKMLAAHPDDRAGVKVIAVELPSTTH